MGDVRFATYLRLIRDAPDPGRAIREMADDAVVSALAAASREHDPYLANVLATEAMNRMRRNATLVDLASEGLLAVDAEGRLRHANPAAEELLGRSLAEMVGEDVHGLLHPEADEGWHADGDPCPLRRVLAEGKTVRKAEGDFARRDGSRLAVAFAATPVMQEDDVMGAVVAFHDIRPQREAQEKLAALRAQVDEQARSLDAVLESITDAFFALDRSWRFTYLNPQAERLLERPRAQLLGRNVWEEFPEALGTEFERRYREVMATGRPAHFEIFYAPLDIWVEVHAFPAAGGLSVYFRDVTKRRAAAEEVRRMNAELEDRVRRRTRELAQANRELESFSYSVSHDLRGPLRGIDYFAELLEEEHGASLDAEGREHLRRLRAEAQRLGQHIQGLLEVSRASLGPLDRRSVDLSHLVEEIGAALSRRNPEREVRFDVQPGLLAEAEPRLVRSVLENLLSNAWKFTARAPQAVISFSAVEDADGRTVYTVRDNGAGFDMTRVASLFRSFERLHAASEFEGTGVGLATVKRIVERHGGRIWAEGEPGKGAAFHFTLG